MQLYSENDIAYIHDTESRPMCPYTLRISKLGDTFGGWDRVTLSLYFKKVQTALGDGNHTNLEIMIKHTMQSKSCDPS